MEDNKKKNKVLDVSIILLLFIILGLVCYIFINKNNNTSTLGLKENTINAENTEKDNTISKEEKKQIYTQINLFDSSKSLNSNENKYTLACQGNAGIFIEVNSSQKELTFNYTPTKVVEFYSLDWATTKESMNSDKIKFDKKIIDVFFGGMGQGNSGDTLFILLEDGTVEYIPIVHMFNNVQGAAISYGKINEVNNVIKFSLADTYSNGVTTLAIREDGTFYDMWYELEKTGNY